MTCHFIEIWSGFWFSNVAIMPDRIYSLDISYCWPILWACFSSETKRYSVPCTDCHSAPLGCVVWVVWGGGQAGQGFIANQGVPKWVLNHEFAFLYDVLPFYFFLANFQKHFALVFSSLEEKKVFLRRKKKKRDCLLKIQGFLSKDLRIFYHSSQSVRSFTGFKTSDFYKCFFKINIVRVGLFVSKKKKKSTSALIEKNSVSINVYEAHK